MYIHKSIRKYARLFLGTATAALSGAIVIGPRIGRFNTDGTANKVPGRNIPLGVHGTIVFFFGWFGFNPGKPWQLMVQGTTSQCSPQSTS